MQFVLTTKPGDEWFVCNPTTICWDRKYESKPPGGEIITEGVYRIKGSIMSESGRRGIYLCSNGFMERTLVEHTGGGISHFDILFRWEWESKECTLTTNHHENVEDGKETPPQWCINYQLMQMKMKRSSND